jgi:16S rRNA (guanine527-N7)-methyltransferase
MEVLDIGGSNGLPGLVLSALSPHIGLKICDSRHKRKAFLQEACEHLGTGATFEMGRVDSEIFRSRYHRAFDLIVARAVAKLKRLLRWCLPLLKPGGNLIAYKGSRCFEEVDQAAELLFRSGGAMIMILSSPWAQECNPLRLFTIAGLSAEGEVGMWEG